MINKILGNQDEVRIHIWGEIYEPDDPFELAKWDVTMQYSPG